MRKKRKLFALKHPITKSPATPSELSEVQAEIKPSCPACVSIPPYPHGFKTSLSAMRFGVLYRFTREDAFPHDAGRLVEGEGNNKTTHEVSVHPCTERVSEFPVSDIFRPSHHRVFGGRRSRLPLFRLEPTKNFAQFSRFRKIQ